MPVPIGARIGNFRVKPRPALLGSARALAAYHLLHRSPLALQVLSSHASARAVRSSQPHILANIGPQRCALAESVKLSDDHVLRADNVELPKADDHTINATGAARNQNKASLRVMSSPFAAAHCNRRAFDGLSNAKPNA